MLQQFYTERAESEKRFEDLKTAAEEQRSECRFYMDMFSEDWNASQFWVRLSIPCLLLDLDI